MYIHWNMHLELSKVLMYDIRCDYMKNTCDKNSRLLFKDTDSLVYEMKTEDVYEDFSSDKEMFDLTKSNYCDDSNKDEIANIAIKEFVGLKPKMYQLLIDNSSETIKRAKRSEEKCSCDNKS